MRGIIFSAPMIRALLAGRKSQTRRPIKNLSIDLPREVRGDWPFDAARAEAGRHPARLNAGGAVSITDIDLGVKPGEFHFVCPYAPGTTVLADHASPSGLRSLWTIIPDQPCRLWVRERMSLHDVLAGGHGRDVAIYDADESAVPYLDTWPWKVQRLSPIFMPFGCRRIELVVESVRVERLQDISEADARAEGVDGHAQGEWPDGFGSWSRKGEPITGRPWAHQYLQAWMELHGSESVHANPWVWTLTFRTELRDA